MDDLVKLFGFIIYAIYIVSSLWLLLNGIIQLHLVWHSRNKKGLELKYFATQPHPFVSIQVPVYNEKYVIERLLLALAQLNYPKDKFEIQVLDDSTDETSNIIDATVLKLKQENIDIDVVRRKERKGFKAGALQYGLPLCKGNLIAIFDADFVPQPDFLNRLVPNFSDPKVGLVQARWEHLNRDENCLTKIQSFLLDTHFSVEQSGRFKAGYFINFCGTAGIWRKQCIEEAGGWDDKVLSEDLDLSYRAQLKNWKLIYDESTSVPAELPSVMEAFKIQQFRWTKGMAQISRKTIKAILSSAYPLAKKLHSVFHLLSSFVFICIFINALLTVPLLIYRNLYPEFISLTKYSLFTSINLIALTLFFYHGSRNSKQVPLRFINYFPLFLTTYMGLSVQNTIAVLQGLFGSSSVFVRTPKFNTSGTNNIYLSKNFNWINVAELFVFFYFVFGITLSFYLNDYFMMLFFLMITHGLGYILYHSLPVIKFKNTGKSRIPALK